MPDPEEMVNAIDEWMPDFIAWAENPDHPLAGPLFERARKRVHRDYLNDDSPESSAFAEETVIVLAAVAEWLINYRGLTIPLDPELPAATPKGTL